MISLVLPTYATADRAPDLLHVSPQARQLIDWWVEGRVNPHVPTTQRLPLSRADDAFAMIAARKTTGKVVLVP